MVLISELTTANLLITFHYGKPTAAALKDELGERAWQAALDSGKTLTQDEAIDIALRRR